MTTQQAIEALHALPRLGQGAPGLARMQNLMDHLGNPEKELQCIHIAGTNGKGSLAAMTSSILTAAGYKTGLTISPYVVDFRERFQIDGEMIPPRTLAAYLSGEIDHHAAQSIRREIDAQVDDRLPELLTLDFSGVTFMDSSGVGLILGRGRHISALGGRLTVQNPPPAVRRMLDLARITYA